MEECFDFQRGFVEGEDFFGPTQILHLLLCMVHTPTVLNAVISSSVGNSVPFYHKATSNRQPDTNLDTLVDLI